LPKLASKTRTRTWGRGLFLQRATTPDGVLLIQPCAVAPEKALPVSSSLHPAFPAEMRTLFREVLGHLNRGKVPYVVAGAFALQQHTGVWRDTKDLDLFVPAPVVSEALGHLEELGFAIEISDPVWLAKAHRDGYYVDFITGMSNAIITVDQSWIERGAESLVLGVRARVLAAEELIASKLFVNFRERFDGADIAHVIYASRGRLDWARLRQIAGEHWEILLWELVLFHYVYPSQQDYVPREVWDDLLARLRSQLDSPGQPGKFRGSLIDDKMFAIDVQEWGLENLLEEQRQRRFPKIERAA
jgi:Nucleotidyl transferase of unknown function (DUF2204)